MWIHWYTFLNIVNYIETNFNILWHIETNFNILWHIEMYCELYCKGFIRMLARLLSIQLVTSCSARSQSKIRIVQGMVSQFVLFCHKSHCFKKFNSWWNYTCPILTFWKQNLSFLPHLSICQLPGNIEVLLRVIDHAVQFRVTWVAAQLYCQISQPR